MQELVQVLKPERDSNVTLTVIVWVYPCNPSPEDRLYTSKQTFPLVYPSQNIDYTQQQTLQQVYINAPGLWKALGTRIPVWDLFMASCSALHL